MNGPNRHAAGEASRDTPFEAPNAREPQPYERAPVPPVPPVPDVTTNILLVDDKQENLTALTAVLEPLGQRLVYATSGVEALRQLLTGDYAVILLDVRMPGIDGFETASLIKQRERTRDIPIIFLSALSTDASFVFKGYTVGAVDYLSKPFDPHILRSKVGVFVDLFRKNEQIKRQAEMLRVSEQREQERALAELKRKSERQYRDLAESMPQIVWMGRPDGAATYFNRRWFEYTGLGEREWGHDPWSQVLHPEDVESYLRRWEWAVETGEPCEAEYRLRRAADGCYRWHLSRALPVRGEDGQVLSWIGTSTDIDDQKGAEQALRFLTDAGRLLASSLDYRETLPAVARLCVPYLGDWCAIETFEAQGAELIAAVSEDPERENAMRSLGRFVPDAWRADCDGKPEIFPPLEQPSDGEATATLPPLIHELGSASYMIVPFSARGQMLGALTLGRTATERRFTPPDIVLVDTLVRRIAFAVDNAQLYADAQRERAKLEEANRAKDEFLATLSHELRTPLNAMLGWTKLLRTGQLDAEASSRALETIERNTKAQAQLIEDLLDMSRIIAGKIRLDVRLVELAPVIEAAVESVRPTLGKDITLETAITASGVVRGDADRLQQIVWNLLTNAIKFTPEGGRVELRLSARGGQAEIAIADTGVGIKPEFLPHIFDRFRQADSSSSRRHGGLGLGLAIVRHLVELHGGSVAVASEGEGKGSTFSVSLPLAKDEVIAAGAATLDGQLGGVPHLAGLRLLVAEDDPDARELMQVILEGCDAHVTMVETAREALAAIAAGPPDVVVSDIGLPGEDGYWLIGEIRALDADAGGATPAIALTAYASEQDRLRVLEAGFHYHLAKPVDPDLLVATIAEAAVHARGARSGQ